MNTFTIEDRERLVRIETYMTTFGEVQKQHTADIKALQAWRTALAAAWSAVVAGFGFLKTTGGL